MGLSRVLDTETGWVSEVDPDACKVLDARLPGVPNVGDLTVLDWSTVPPVDVLTAGYPCQPFSTAGRRKGTSDVRHLWPFIADAIGVLRPGLVVLENVAGHLSLGFDVVLADLARLGYDARWCVVRASDIGACHRRARLFVVAHPQIAERRGPQLQGVGAPCRPTAESRECFGSRRDVADSNDIGCQRDGRAWGRGTGLADAGCPTPTDAGRPGPQGQEPAGRRDVSTGSGGEPRWGVYGPAIARHTIALGRPAPDPVDRRGRLNPVFVEWMMMLPRGWVTDIVTNRSKALKCLGNGVVPPQAAFALRRLLEAL